MAKFPERVFSGVQPTGNLHLGNYLGAIKRFVEMQKTHPCIYCVVDLHAMTLPHDPSQLARATREVTAAFLACGIDSEGQYRLQPEPVAEHAELTWALDCVARLGWLNRMTQFKEKAGKDRENASIGLFNYPVLMAADILLYRATHVPVGDDPKQHLELTRDIAQKFNNDFAASIDAHGHGDAYFPLPEPLIQGPATRSWFARRRPRRCRNRIRRNSRISPSPTMRMRSRRRSAGPRPIPSRSRAKSRVSSDARGRQPRRHFRRPER